MGLSSKNLLLFCVSLCQIFASGEMRDLAETLKYYVERSGFKPPQLARLSGIPEETIVNWLTGRVKKTRKWQALVKVAKALHLSESEVTALLESAGYPSVEELYQRAEDEDRELFSFWERSIKERQSAPFQTPRRLPYFVRREAEIQKLREVLLSSQGAMICSLQGMGGIGKTTLATYLAYELRPHFPDGVLWARVDTANTMNVLSSFAEAYGRDVSKYTDLESRSSVVREVLANKQALMVLDNVQHSYEVTHLLPPTTGKCAVIITTRRHDLPVTYDIHRQVLEPFSEEKGESLSLFARLLGSERVCKEQAALESIAALLGHLPLAIAIAGGRLAHEPGWTAADFLTRLRQEEGRLRMLANEQHNVQLSFDISYGLLQPERQRFFGALGVFAGEDFSAEAAAAIAEAPPETAQDYLRELYRLSLVQLGRPDRYKLHPLLRDYARQKMKARDDLLRRMSLYFTEQAQANERNYAYLDLEYGNIVAALQAARQFQLYSAFVQGVHALYYFWETRGLYTEAEPYLRQAKRAARAAGETNSLPKTLLNLGSLMIILGKYRRAEVILHHGLAMARSGATHPLAATFLLRLGVAAYDQGETNQAETYFLQGRELAQAIGDEEGIMSGLLNLSGMAHKRGDPRQAEAYLRDGLASARQREDREKVCKFLTNLAATITEAGQYEEAEACLLEALTIAEEMGHCEKVSVILSNLGYIARKQEKYVEAEAYLQRGLELARKINHRARMIPVLVNLGNVAQACGEESQAENHLAEALQLARALQHSWLITETLYYQGEVYLAQQKYDQARLSFQESLPMIQKLEFPEYVARIKYGLARASRGPGDDENARRLGNESLEIFLEIGHAKAAEVRDWLAQL